MLKLQNILDITVTQLYTKTSYLVVSYLKVAPQHIYVKEVFSPSLL